MCQSNLNITKCSLDVHNGTESAKVEVEVEADWSETLESTSSRFIFMCV